MLEILKESPLFMGLETGEIETLINNTLHQFKQFANREVIAYSGETVWKAIILLEGRLLGEMPDPMSIGPDNLLKIEEIDPPQMVAAAFLYGPQNVFPVNLSALSDGKLLVIFKKDFTQMLSKDQRVLNNYLNIVSAKAQFLTKRITFLSLKTIRKKIAYLLMQKLNKDGTTLMIDQNQTQLAGLMGVTRPSLARAIGEMEREGLIKWNRNEILIINPDKLNSALKG